MDSEYDVIFLGTGLTECILSGILSMEGKKVLHLDRHEFYGGACASVHLSKLFELFRKPDSYDGSSLGKDREFNIDLVPKFMFTDGELVQLLVQTDATRYLEFQQISGSFVYRDGSGICKVPATEYEAATSSLMGFFEKRRAKRFFEYLQKIDPKNPTTWGSYNLHAMPMIELFDKFGLEAGTQDFLGHALALHLDEQYLRKPALDTCARIKLYMSSMLRFGKSPYVYPLYGLGELPQAFARLSAIYGGTYMLNQPVDEILYDEAGKACGIRCGEQVARCQAIFCDPSYAPQMCIKSHQVIRAICILEHPIPSTNNTDSCQIIIPQRQLGRNYDVYITCLSAAHQVCPAGKYLAMVSTIVETASPEREIEFALSILGPIKEKFIWISDMLDPLDDGRQNQLFLSRSYDATSHFETVYQDIQSLYERFAGRPLQVRKRPTAEEEQEKLSQSLSTSLTEV